MSSLPRQRDNALELGVRGCPECPSWIVDTGADGFYRISATRVVSPRTSPYKKTENHPRNTPMIAPTVSQKLHEQSDSGACGHAGHSGAAVQPPQVQDGQVGQGGHAPQVSAGGAGHAGTGGQGGAAGHLLRYDKRPLAASS